MSSQQGMFDFANDLPWEQQAADECAAAEVVINAPLTQPYTYQIPDALREQVLPGQRVRVPLGRGGRLVIGYVIAVHQSHTGTRRLKEIHELLDAQPLLSSEMLQLTEWISERYLCSWGQVLESVIPAGVRKRSGTRMIRAVRLAEGYEQRLDSLRLSAAQHRVLQVLRTSGETRTAAQLCQAAECSPSPVNTLQKHGILTFEKVRTEVAAAADFPADHEDHPEPQLNPQQEAAHARILRIMESSEYETILLHGVTGSGKTEVYIRAIRECVSYGRQAIVLVPEISLTPQTIRRFRSRFQRIAVLHSHMSDTERHSQWQTIASGDVDVVVGARSAVFAPTPHLGMIIIDEEHEPTFKQDTTPRYHAREVARERCRRLKIPLILGSATPTLESWLRAGRGTDKLISMPDRVARLPMPPVVIVDTRQDPRVSRGSAIGRALQQAVRHSLEDGGQIILFLNLRGYSPTVWCRSCGQGIKCSDCDLTLTWHRDRSAVVCHGCDFEAKAPEQCPSCQSQAIRFLGIGTQRLEEEVRALFPSASVLRMDSDTMKKPGSHDEALSRFRRQEIQILLGTQMIAKGLDFPNVTLVGVIDADTILNQPDFRASERTFQLVAQVAGRTGRSDRGGRVLVQTSNPTEPAIQFARRHDFPGFASHELQERHELKAPPFSSMVRVILRGPSERITRETAQAIAEKLRSMKESDSIRILGAAPAPISRLRGLYRFHLQITAPDFRAARELWTSTERHLKLPTEVEFAVDVDPLNTR